MDVVHMRRSPFLKRGTDTGGMMLAMLLCVSVPAIHFSLRYDGSFFTRYLFYLICGCGMDVLYGLLNDQRLRAPRSSTPVTAALLVLSVPAYLPWPMMLSGLFVAIVLGKCMMDTRALRLNPMLLGRLFLMLAFPDAMQGWLKPGIEISGFTSATPLGLALSERANYSTMHLLTGSIGGDWEGIVTMLPGAPGEVMPFLSLTLGIILLLTGIADWRASVTFVVSFALTARIAGLSLPFHLIAGSIFFTAAFIVTDPRSMPGSKSGRLAAGLIAGTLNAVIRSHGFYPEGIVFAVLAANLLSPLLDRSAFALRGYIIARRHL